MAGLDWSGLASTLPEPVRKILTEYDEEETKNRTDLDRARLVIQALAAVVLALASTGLRRSEVWSAVRCAGAGLRSAIISPRGSPRV